MKRPTRATPILALTMLLAGCSAGGEPPATPAAGTASLDLASLMERARIPGMSLAVIEDGAIASVEAFGVTDAESGNPVTEETLFEAASLSKPVFATIALRWAERGDLDLDQPLTELLPYERFGNDPRANEITARLVLSHQTGLPNWGGERLDFRFDPGAGFGYSGEGYVYLQHVLEKLAGEDLDTIARREIFEPLGMTRSRFDWPQEDPSPVTRRHDEIGRPGPPARERDQNAAASLLTNAEEYGRFVVAWMNGELLERGTIDAALTPVVRMRGTETHTPRPPEVYERVAWGFGWGLSLPEGIVWHWGDNGPAKALVAWDPGSRAGFVYFANADNGLAIGTAVAEALLGDLGTALAWAGYEPCDAPGFVDRLEGLEAEKEGRWEEAIAAFERAARLATERQELAHRADWLRDILTVREHPVELPQELLRRYAGIYGDARLFLENGELHAESPLGRYRLVPLNETTFALDGPPTFRLEVVTDEEGRPVKLVGHSLQGSREWPRS